MSSNNDRFFKMAEVYDKLVKYFLPRYDFLQDEVINLLDFNQQDPIKVINLGAGSGIFLEKILNKYTRAKCYWIDFSDDFLNIAKKRLECFADRVEYILLPIEEDWENECDNNIQLITSMSTIHHLENHKKNNYMEEYIDH
ncbi:MAG: class I SAM-dependent methyltransferase [Promethearchaeota archaeon]